MTRAGNRPTERHEIDKATLEKVAKAWAISESELSRFEVWLSNLARLYRDATSSYGDCLTKQQTIDCFTPIETAARDVELKLKDPWINDYMVGHELKGLLSRQDISTNEHFQNGYASINQSVGRDVQAVTRLVERTRAIRRELENRDSDADEQIAGVPALKAKAARAHVEEMILKCWVSKLGRSDISFGKKSPFVKAVVAVDEFLGLPPMSIKGIKARFVKLLKPHAEKN